jgi:hypothetical protein
MKDHLRGSHFEAVEEIQKVTTVLNNAKKNDLWKCLPELEATLGIIYSFRKELL